MANTFSAELTITDARDRTRRYRLAPLAADPEVALGAWRLTKLGKAKDGNESYDVCLREEGFWTCECLGYLAHNSCKHVKVLARLLGGGVPVNS